MRLLPSLLAAFALFGGSCTGSSGASEDLASVEDRASEAVEGDPVLGPSDEVDVPVLASLTLEVDPLPTAPGTHDLVVTTVEDTGRRTDRGVRLVVPAGDGPFPLIVALHPFGGTGAGFDRGTGLGTRGAEAGAIVVLPDGVDGAWNAAITCCQPAVGEERPDVAFILALVDEVSLAFDVDTDRVGATGFSNGGYLAYRVACDTAVFTSIVPVAGTMDRPCAAPAPISVLHIHGDADQVIPMVDDRAPFTPGAESRGARHVVDFWARRGGCGVPQATDLTASVTFGACAEGVAVELLGVPGLGHQWPESPDATSQALAFLLEH